MQNIISLKNNKFFALFKQFYAHIYAFFNIFIVFSQNQS